MSRCPKILDDSPASAEARARIYVRHLRHFYLKLIGYGIIVSFLFLINYLSSPSYWWAFWPALGMGLGLAFHASRLLGWKFGWGSDWEERKVAEIMARKEK